MYDGTKALIDCCHNINKGNLKLTKTQKRKLSKYKNQMLAMTNPKIALYKKNRILQQKGGAFLGALLGAAIPALTSLVSSLINKST